MINNLLKFFIYLFIILGVILLSITFIGILNDHVIHLSGKTDWKYLEKVASVCAFLAIPWNIVGIFLLYLTLNTQQQQFKRTDESIKKQQFETTFFNMLDVLSKIKTSTYYEYTTTGKSLTEKITSIKKDQIFFDFALKDLKKHYKKVYPELNGENKLKTILIKVKKNETVNEIERQIIRDDLNEIYLDFYKDFHSHLGHYFRYVFNLIKFAITKRSEYKDEKDYIDLIQAQLTNDELSLIFYNAISDNGLNTKKEYKFYEWLDKYSFFENIDDRSLILREHHILYKTTGFKFLNSDEIERKN